MKGSKKKKMAKKMMTSKEIASHKPMFDSVAWSKRKETRFNKELKRQK